MCHKMLPIIAVCHKMLPIITRSGRDYTNFVKRLNKKFKMLIQTFVYILCNIRIKVFTILTKRSKILKMRNMSKIALKFFDQSNLNNCN